MCKFFPSGIVVLSGGADLRAKVFSAEDGSCPVTLVGHKSGVSDLAIVDRGRNVVTAGRDGELRLWDVGQAKCLDTVAKFSTNINACSIYALDNASIASAINLKRSAESLSNQKFY